MGLLISVSKSIWRLITFPLTLIGLISDLIKLLIIFVIIMVAIVVWQIWFT